MSEVAEERIADVCLVLEGTYPYVQGGVSSWVHQIVTQLSEVTFALFFIGSTREQAVKKRYTPPPNVIAITEVFLFERLPEAQLEPRKLSAKVRESFYLFLRDFHEATDEPGRLAAWWSVIDCLDQPDTDLTFGNLMRDEEAWQLLTDLSDSRAPHESFVDFFWAVRFLHLPVWTALLARHQIPRARMYHSVSTGYAGMLGAIAARRHGVPYLITEHGIYTKERIAEISQAKWIHDPPSRYFDVDRGLGPVKQMWIGLFVFLGRLSYAAADRTISLFEGNTDLQIEFGAEARRLEVVPNGIDPAIFDPARERRRKRLEQPGGGIVIGFIGRVVPIKDVKTLIRAARSVVAREPRARFHLIGPTEEDPDYFAECRQMVELMGLKDQVLFLGPQNVREILSDLDLCVMTSISEGLPLVILEGFSAGVPCVATDVGACRELIFGRTPEDKALGRAGLLTKICSPLDTADALLQVISDPENLVRMGEAGRTRVERYYRQDDIMDIYRRYYTDTAWAGPDAPDGPYADRAPTSDTAT
ncbi:GT4 family glycosyltransferase PelF [Synoicihabitans lomoniglobus]|uniref:GT4 family glycosyltransferase PelF n=1 Tax=Synoicihabitans lomoniglobus TaxID=2909285 RepID=A0AAF0CQE0_9BACT|nr:GT4 family glycosyltransferase PelF [Opitutaceae bacterium LMO-M01]WED66127.1 GT4 family glycosyltransferase PelF [Opitutaceae bacterium LMO-M01]